MKAAGKEKGHEAVAADEKDAFRTSSSGIPERLAHRRDWLRENYPLWTKRTIYGHLREAASRWPDRLLYQDGQRNMTYRQVLEQSDKAANALLQLGVQKGDRIAVNLNNTIEYLILTFAIARTEAVKVPLNRKLPLQQKCYILSETGTSILVSDKTEDMESLHQCAGLRRIILLRHPDSPGNQIISWEIFMGVLAQAEENHDRTRDAEPGAAELPCDIIYTSGSIGAPKGVVLTHDMILRSAFANCLNRAFEDGRRVLITVPLFHVYGYIEGLLSVIFVGGTLLCMQGRFDERKTLTMLQKYRIQDILCVPSAMQKLLAVPDFDFYDLHALHAVYCSASVCPDWLWDEMKKRLGEVEIVTGYGMSETSGASVQTPPEVSFGDLEKLRRTLGRVLTDHFSGKLVEYRVVDPDTLEDLPQGHTGELICRGSIITKGYYNRDDVNKSVFTKDGWLRSGDLGWFDKDGFLVFLGRDGDNYKINGENVSPLYVDQVISESRDVIQAQTIGIPDEKLGWVGAAFIEPASFSQAVKNRIIEFCSGNLASFQVPKYYFFISGKEWPRTSNGKITKKLLREQAVLRINQEKKDLECWLQAGSEKCNNDRPDQTE